MDIIGKVIYAGIVSFFAAIILLIILVVFYFKPTEIKSKELIEPKIELVIKNNQVDTVYIYKLKIN